MLNGYAFKHSYYARSSEIEVLVQTLNDLMVFKVLIEMLNK